MGDSILRNGGVRVFGLPWAQAEVGMPFKISGFIRGISYQGLTIAGGGLRYGLYAASDKPWAPQVLVSAVAHSVVHSDFSASHAGASLVCSAGTPFFAPYAGQFVVAQTGDIAAIKLVAPLVRAVEQTDDIEQRGFARTRRAHD